MLQLSSASPTDTAGFFRTDNFTTASAKNLSRKSKILAIGWNPGVAIKNNDNEKRIVRPKVMRT
jgi:hypothetical protein